METVPGFRVDFSEPAQVKAFESFFSRMPDEQREIAIESLSAVGLPTSQEFLKAYSLGVALVMAAYLGRGPTEEM